MRELYLQVVVLCNLGSPRKKLALEAKFGSNLKRPVPKQNFCCHHIPKDDDPAAAGGKVGLVLAPITLEAGGQQTATSTVPTGQTAAGFSFAFCWF